MRVLHILFVLALGAFPLFSTHAATTDEVTMRIVGVGTAGPDTVILRASIDTSGKTQAEADSVNRVTAARIKASVVAVGVDAKEVTVTASDGAGMASAAAAAVMADESKETADEAPVVTSSSSIQIIFDDVRKLSAIQAVLTAEKSVDTDTPTFITRDAAKARANAINDAIKKARDDANTYANTLGYRIVRITRITNQKASLNFPDVAQFIQLMEGRGKLSVPTYASVEIDYVLAPK